MEGYGDPIPRGLKATPSRRRMLKATGAIAGPRGADVPAHRLGVRRLSGASGQDRGRQHAGRSLRHHRPHHGGRDAGGDRADFHRREQGRRRRQHRHGLGRARRPDGYTILLTTSAYSVNPGLYNSCPTIRSRTSPPICELAVSPHVFAVKSDLGATPMKEFVALVKANPGQVQRLDAADRHHAAAAGRGARSCAKACRRWRPWCLPAAATRSRRCCRGTVQLTLRHAGAGAAADQGRHPQGPGGHRREALARPAGRPDHDRRRATRTSCSTPTPR